MAIPGSPDLLVSICGPGAKLAFAARPIIIPSSYRPSDVGFWHITDARLALTNVCFVGNNGHDADVTRCRLMTQSGHSRICNVMLLLSSTNGYSAIVWRGTASLG
jgi:hypothetical protein